MNTDQDISVPLGYLMTQNPEVSAIAVESDLNVAILEDPTVEESLGVGHDSITVGAPVAVHETAVEGVLCAR